MTTTETDPAAIPDLVLERHQLGELPAAAAAGVRAALDVDGDLRARLEALAADDVRQREQYPPAALAADVQRRVRAGSAPSRAWRYALLAPAAAVLAVIVARGLPPTSPSAGGSDPGVDDDVRIKGVDASLMVYRHVGGGSEPLRESDVARPGDIIRVGYRVSEDAYGAIVSIDGRGVVTQHLPARGGAAAALHAGATVLLDDAFELDDAPRVERFYLVSARHPFDVATVAEAIRATPDGNAARPALADDFTFTTFSLRKEPRP